MGSFASALAGLSGSRAISNDGTEFIDLDLPLGQPGGGLTWRNGIGIAGPTERAQGKIPQPDLLGGESVRPGY